MSTTATKTALRDALEQAEAFQALFDGCYEQWHVAGSVRRGVPEIGDIEHVVIARDGEAPVPGSMFEADRRHVNLLWHRCDELLAAGEIEKQLYRIERKAGVVREPKWGPIMRGISWRGMRHEIWTAVPDNWGAILALRTGPDTFSQMLVSRLNDRGLEQDRGFVRYMRGDRKIYPVRDEEAFFNAAHTTWIEPWKRRNVKLRHNG